MSRHDSIAFFAVIAVALWAFYSVGFASQSGSLSGDSLDLSATSGMVIIGVPAKLTNTIVIGGININEYIGSNVGSFTELHLSSLSSGTADSLEGTTPYHQTLRLYRGGTESFNGGSLKYGRDNDGNVADFIVFPYREPVFEYEVDFDSGLRSKIDGTNLPGFAEANIALMGAPATIYRASVTGNAVELRLFSGGGDLVLRDDDVTDDSYADSVKVNGRNIDAQVRISASVDSNDVSIYRISYRYLAYGKTGGDLYIPAKRGLRQYLRQPEALIHPYFDIIYAGFAGGVPGSASKYPTQSQMAASYPGNLFFEPVGGDRYNIVFTSLTGRTIRAPYVALVSGTPRLGDSNRELVAKEGANTADFNIAPGDYFIATSKNDVSGMTSILSYNSFSTSTNEVSFTIIGGGTVSTHYDPASNRGRLNTGGGSFDFYVDPASEKIVVDQNGDGAFNGATANIVVQGGAQIEPGASSTTIRIARKLFDNPPTNDETTTINFFASGSKIDVQVPIQTSVTPQSGSDRRTFGMTTYGVQFTLDDRGNPPSTLSVDIPGGNRHPSVAVRSRPITSSSSTVGQISKGGQTGGVVVVTYELRRFLPSSSGSKTSSGVGVND